MHEDAISLIAQLLEIEQAFERRSDGTLSKNIKEVEDKLKLLTSDPRIRTKLRRVPVRYVTPLVKTRTWNLQFECDWDTAVEFFMDGRIAAEILASVDHDSDEECIAAFDRVDPVTAAQRMGTSHYRQLHLKGLSTNDCAIYPILDSGEITHVVFAARSTATAGRQFKELSGKWKPTSSILSELISYWQYASQPQIKQSEGFTDEQVLMASPEIQRLLSVFPRSPFYGNHDLINHVADDEHLAQTAVKHTCQLWKNKTIQVIRKARLHRGRLNRRLKKRISQRVTKPKEEEEEGAVECVEVTSAACTA